MKYLFLILIIFFLPRFSIAQNCVEIDSLIPVGKKIYVIGETHIDQPLFIYKDGPWMDTIRNVAAEAEEKFRNIIHNTCNVKTFLLEAPLSFQYFYNRYFETGDEGWIENVAYYKYERSKLRSLYALKKSDSTIQIKCIDVDNSDHVWTAVKTLFFLTFYETEPSLFTNDTLKYYPEINPKTVLAEDLAYKTDMWEKPKFKTIDFIAEDIYDVYDKSIINRRKKLYDIFSRIKTDITITNKLKEFYGVNYDYLMQLADSYISSYHLKYKKNLEDTFYKEREEIIYKNIFAAIEADTSRSVCLQIGAGHIISHKYFENVYQKLETDFKNEIFSFIMMAEYNSCYNCLGIEMNFDFEGHLCYRVDSDNRIYYVIK